jgi:hypothetical protein
MKINSVLLQMYTVAMTIKHCTNTVVEILYTIQTLFPVFPMMNQVIINSMEFFMRSWQVLP